MTTTLTTIEVRVLGALMEKSIVTPEQYPLTLNALTLACNQKSSREPVLNLPQVEVQRAARDLETKTLVKREENFRNGIEKFQQRFCNTPFSNVKLDTQAYGVLTVLLLRGAQTPGELRARVGRLCSFATNDEVMATLQRLIDREGGPLVARLPRKAGRQDHEYAHLLGGEVESVALDVPAPNSVIETPESSERLSGLEARISELENLVATLQEKLRGN